jgi:hypothetical protein
MPLMPSALKKQQFFVNLGPPKNKSKKIKKSPKGLESAAVKEHEAI